MKYKVFIDDKPIEFASKLKKIKKCSDSVIIKVADIEQTDLIAYRQKLPAQIAIIVVCPDPETCIKRVFSGYDFIEAAGGIVRRKNKYLFIERLGKWDLPKGKIEKGEEPFYTAVREVEEECGIPGVETDKFIGVTFHTYDCYGAPTLKKNWWYSMSYDGPKKLIPQEEESITKAVWLKKEDFEMVTENTYASILEVLKMSGEIEN